MASIMEVELQPIREGGNLPPDNIESSDVDNLKNTGLQPIREDGNLPPVNIESSDVDNLKATGHTSETDEKYTSSLKSKIKSKMVAMEIGGDAFEFNPPKDSIVTFLYDWGCTVLIGFLVVSYWRGGWVFFDHYSCGQPGGAGMLNGESFCFQGLGTVEPYRRQTAIEALIAGYILFGSGVTLLSFGFWRPQKTFVKDAPTLLRHRKRMLRVLILLLLGGGAICIWRGIWYMLDYYVYPDDPYFSWQFTAILGAIICLSLCSSASMLAPPAIFLMDGPSHLPPPIGVTIITSYRSIAYPSNAARDKSTKDPMWLVILDIIISFIVLPIGVVSFWRGMWGLLDTWYWNFTDSQADINRSILWSFVVGMSALFIGSEDIAQHFSPEKILKSKWAIVLANMTFGRVRTLVLAFGAVNFWRFAWLFWDEFLGQTHAWSAILSHCLGIIGLLLLGCLSCIAAPPSTLGVDAIAHPDCADEPLFHNTPVPWEVLYFTAIARRPEALLTKVVIGPDGSRRFDPDVLNDPSVRSTMSQNILPCVENLLVQDDYVYTDSARTTRFTEQTSSLVQSANRHESSSMLRLSVRQMAKRNSSQFFRSR